MCRGDDAKNVYMLLILQVLAVIDNGRRYKVSFF